MAEYEIVTLSSQPILFVHRKSAIAPEAIGATMAEAFGTLMAFLQQSGIEIAGAPLSLYRDYSETETVFDVAVPIAAADSAKADADADVTAGETPSGRALKAVHKGPYDKLAETYDAIMAHIRDEGLTATGPILECYVNDPDSTPPEELLTEIYFPIE